MPTPEYMEHDWFDLEFGISQCKRCSLCINPFSKTGIFIPQCVEKENKKAPESKRPELNKWCMEGKCYDCGKKSCVCY